MLRAIVTAGFLLLSALLFGFSWWVGTDGYSGDLLLNLGTEIMGIVLTVAIVDWFFERRRQGARAKQLAWNALHAIEHAVWVWQGGPRQMETDEMLGLLHAVTSDDPLPEFTQNLFMSVGTRAKQSVKDDPQALKAFPGLHDAFEQLARLASIRDGLDLYPPPKVASIVSSGVSHLALVLGLPDERIPARLIRYREPTLQSQEQRHFGIGRSGRGGRTDAVEL